MVKGQSDHKLELYSHACVRLATLGSRDIFAVAGADVTAFVQKAIAASSGNSNLRTIRSSELEFFVGAASPEEWSQFTRDGYNIVKTTVNCGDLLYTPPGWVIAGQGSMQSEYHGLRFSVFPRVCLTPALKSFQDAKDIDFGFLEYSQSAFCVFNLVYYIKEYATKRYTI